MEIKEHEKIDKYLDLARELKKTVENEGDSDTNCNWCTWGNHKRLGRKTGETENQSKNQNHPDHSIAEISKNTHKNAGELSLRLRQ